MVELIKEVHGSFESKNKLIEDFAARFTDCSKLSVEKKIKEGFVKDKRGDDPKLRYYALPAIIEEACGDLPVNSFNLELERLAAERA